VRLKRDESLGRAFAAELLGVAGHRFAVDRPTAILPGDKMGRDRVRLRPPKRAQHLDLLVAHRGRIEVGRRLHRHQRQQLQHVVLDHVAQRPGAVVIIAAALEADRLGDADLDMIDMGAVPQRLEQRIGEAQSQQVLDRFLAEIMVDPERALFGKGGGDRVVDLAARFEIRTERLFERQPDRRAGQARGREPVDGRPEQGWCRRQENCQPVGRIADRFGETGKSGRIADVERHVPQSLQEARADFVIVEAGRKMVGKRLLRLLAKAVVVKLGPGSADDRQALGEQSVGVEPVEGRQKHPARQVPGRSEQQQCGNFIGHAALYAAAAGNAAEFRPGTPRRLRYAPGRGNCASAN
jgi:hypothetical protein